jgi:hypothetical protein
MTAVLLCSDMTAVLLCSDMTAEQSGRRRIPGGSSGLPRERTLPQMGYFLVMLTVAER